MRSLRLLTAMLLAGGLVASPALAAHHSRHHASIASITQSTNPQQNPNLANADALLQNSSGVINQMNGDSNLVSLLRTAKAVLIVPNSAGATPELANAGVMLQDNNGRWTNPAFFSAGGGGSQAGVSRMTTKTGQNMPAPAGQNYGQPGASNAPANANGASAGGNPVAILIMSDRALNRFLSKGNLSLGKASHLNVVNYSNGAQTSPSSDLIVWSGNNAPIGFTSIRSNPAFDHAIYGTSTMRSILAGRAPLTNQLATNLSSQMPQASTTVGMIQTTPPMGKTRAG